MLMMLLLLLRRLTHHIGVVIADKRTTRGLRGCRARTVRGLNATGRLSGQRTADGGVGGLLRSLLVVDGRLLLVNVRLGVIVHRVVIVVVLLRTLLLLDQRRIVVVANVAGRRCGGGGRTRGLLHVRVRRLRRGRFDSEAARGLDCVVCIYVCV